MLSKPCENTLVILRRQTIDSGLDLFNAIHAWSLAFSREEDLPNSKGKMME